MTEPEAAADPPAWHGAPLQPLAGGYSGETFVAGPPGEQVVFRVYSRPPERAEVDASLLRLVRGLVPVPEVLEVRRPRAGAPGVLVTSYVEGVRLDVALGDGTARLLVVGRGVAKVLDALGGIPFLRPGMFAGSDLAVTGFDAPPDLRQWAEQHRVSGRLGGWPDAEWARLAALLDIAQDLLDAHADGDGHADAAAGPPRTSLVHSDLNPKNLLIDPATSEVVALVDWEFAHAGSPYADLGNFCRFERDPRLVEPLLAGLLRFAGLHPDDLVRRARAADLWALVELAGRPRGGPVPDLAAELLRAQARAGDLDAWPWPTHRVELRRDAA